MSFKQYADIRDFSSSGTAAATFGVNVTVGSVLCGMVQWNDDTSTLGTVGDGVRTFTLRHNPVSVGGGARAALFYYENHPGGATTVTATMSAGTPSDVRIFVHEYDGLATSGAFDQSALNSTTVGGAGTDNLTSGIVTTTANGETIVGFGMMRSGGPTMTAGTGFTIRDNVGLPGASEDRVQTTLGNVEVLFSMDGGDQSFAGIMTFMLPTVSTGGPRISRTILRPSAFTPGLAR